MAGDFHSYTWQRTDANFCSIFYVVGIAEQVRKRLSHHCPAHASRSMFASVLLIYTVLIVSSNGSEAFGQQPLLSLHQHHGSTSQKSPTTSTIRADQLFVHLSSRLLPLSLFGLHLPVSSATQHTNIFTVFGFFFQFKVSFSPATSIIPVLCSVSYRTIQWDFLTQAGIGHMSWQTKSDSVQPSAKLSGRYPKTNYQLSLNLNLGEIIAIFWMEAGLMAHQGKWGPETETRNEQDGECENTFMFPNTNESLHQTHNANLYSTRKPK